jgi:uncharacterized membrane protein HdeD (DUF308 family)
MYRAVDVDLLIRNGWAVALRAVLASAFGASVMLGQGMPMPALVIAYGMYSVVDGIFAFFAAVQRRGPNEAPRWAYLVVGLSGLGLGLVMLMWGGLTIAVLVYLVAASASISGLAQVAGALRLRQQVHGEWLMALGGLVGVALGVAMVALGVGSATLAGWVGGYRLVDGAILGALALRLRSWEKQALARAAAEAVVATAIDVSFQPQLELIMEPELEISVEPVIEAVPEPALEARQAHAVASPSAE